MRKIVAFYPFQKRGVSYIYNMQSMIESKYEVIDYRLLKKFHIDLLTVRTIYLNWIENDLEEDDIKLLKEAKRHRVKIIWVFHNKASHDAELRQKSIENIKFLTQVSDKIILHSKTSVNILKEYNSNINLKKTVYVEHPEFIGQYGTLKCKNNMMLKEETGFVFGLYGNIRPYKNIEILINAFLRLDDNYKCRLVITGSCTDKEYLDKLFRLKGNDERIVIHTHFIEDMEMQTYLDYADVLVLPYSYASSMNSGAMLMAFSYQKTVIVPDICMAEDFPEDLIYKYHYENEQEHIEVLYHKVEEVYNAGRQEIAMKGKKLFDIVKKDYNRDCVKEKLLRLV